jgi:hypothetical protein
MIEENPQSVLTREEAIDGIECRQLGLLETIRHAPDADIDGMLKALNTSAYNAGIDGIVNMVIDIQRDIRELAQHFPRLYDQQINTIAFINTLSDAALVNTSRCMRLFSSSDHLDTIRNMLASEIDRRRSHVMRLKRLRVNASTSYEEMARAIRSATASAKMSSSSALDGVHAIATIIRSTGADATRRGAYAALMRTLVVGHPSPAGLPRPIDMCARRVLQTEHIKRCSQWNACTNVCSRRGRIYITDTIAIDVSTVVKSEEVDDHGKYIVDVKLRESHLLGVLECERVQAQILMSIYDVDRLLHTERCELDWRETWISRCDAIDLSEMISDLRRVVIDKVLGQCVVTKCAQLLDIHGHACGDAGRIDIDNHHADELSQDLEGVWTCRKTSRGDGFDKM